MSAEAITQEVRFDRALIDKYNRSGPRYTSYPTAPQFHEGFGPVQFRAAAAHSNLVQPPRPLSLYVHIPFCDTVCYYCACNKTVTPDRTRVLPYLEHLYREIALCGALFDRARPVVQLHFGGGTPTYLTLEQMTELMGVIRQHFTLVDDGHGEYGIEVDPREVPSGTITGLAGLGFNRISVGVQDLDPKVQKAVNRIQPLELTRDTVAEARAAGFVSVNLDLIYGLPFQTEAGFRETLETVIREISPDRLAVFNYAHLPQYFPPQRRINAEELPTPDEKLRIMESTIHTLTAAGYVYVGMDHFAKPGDELAVAQRNGVLHRNFQGYTTHGECDLISLGSTAISQVGSTYSQNRRELPEYYQAIGAGELAIFRGMELSGDDLFRREVIMRLICDFRLDRNALGARFGLDFNDYFKDEMPEVRRMIDEGLLEESGPVLAVTPAGRLLIRNICMAFDWYLKHAEQKKTFSRTI